jgi:hypothetical protein
MTSVDKIAMMIKVEQLDLFMQARALTYREASELFDRFGVWGFIDAAYEGLHVQGEQASFEDIRDFINRQEAARC